MFLGLCSIRYVNSLLLPTKDVQLWTDIWAAFCRGSVTIVAPEKWYENDFNPLEFENQSPDDHAHTLLWLFAQVVNFIAKRMSMDKHLRQRKWEDIFDRLTLWATLGCDQTQAIVDVDPVNTGSRDTSSETCFPTIIYSNNSSGEPLW